MLGATLVAPNTASGHTAGDPAADSAAPDPIRTTTVTLVTGDVVQLSTYPDGRQAAAVQRGPASEHGNFQTVERDGHAYVIPDVAAPYLRSGLLDEKLFDVTGLAAQGYTEALPLILEYGTSAASLRARSTPAGARKLRDLPSIGATTVDVRRAEATRFWQSVDDNRPEARVSPRLDRNLRRISLDAKVTVSLDASVPKIGAPAAWQAGYDGTGVTVAVLDTGIDDTHPDLAGRVAEAVNFSDAPETTDRYGHGTHVASTVAGSGAASGGRYKGVAPGAKLLSGKVLNNSGSGETSWIIAGMEWAAARAKVVSMSLGGGPTDGTDPLSQAVNRLSAQYGTLFVIAAGNSGPRADTVAAPGAADAALTVGASTKTDVLAGFSSRGPRLGDRAVKPEIVAPGVDIVAARAAGTLPDQAVGDRYAKLSGTSMATPHVSGAAAILAQQHPGWTGQQLKSLLTSTASPLGGGTGNTGGTVYEQGAGRVDLARAVGQHVTASTGTLNMGRFTGPYGSVEAVRKTVTYRNDGPTDVTLDLALAAKSATGAVAGPDMLSVSPATLSVPAGGSADATVSIDPDTGELGLYSGRLVATARDGQAVLAAAVGFEKELLHTLSMKAIARDGRPSGFARISLWSLDTNAYQVFYSTGEVVNVQVRQGQYLLFGSVATMDEPGRTDTELTAIAKPELTVSRDTEVVLDARGAKPVNVRTSKATEQVGASHQVARRIPGVGTLIVSIGTATSRLFVVPSEPATRGQFEYMSRTDLEAPALTMRIAGPDVALHPRYLTPDTDVSSRLDGHRRLPAVFVGAGRPDDFVGRDVRGKVALVRSTPGLSIEDQVAAAATAKAAMVAVLAAGPGVFRPYVNPAVRLPTVGLSQAEGGELLRRLGQGKVTLDLEGVAYSPYRYQAVLPYPQVPDGIEHVMDATNTALEHAKVYAVKPNQIGTYTHQVFRPLAAISISLVYKRPFPFQQDRYFSANDTRYGQTFYANFPYDQMVGMYDQFTPGAEVTKTWFKGPLRAGTSAVRPPGARNGDQLLFTFDSFVDAEPDHVNGQQGAKTAARIYRDGALVAQGPYAVGYFDVGTAEPATYRVELDVTEGRPGWTVSPESYSAWTVRSARPTAPGWVPLPVLTAAWDLDLDLSNAAPAGKTFPLRLNAATQPGASPVRVESARAWVSFDDGGTWKQVSLDGQDGRFAGSVRHPKLRDSTGYVALRYEVTDADGGKLEQTVFRAYTLK